MAHLNLTNTTGGLQERNLPDFDASAKNIILAVVLVIVDIVTIVGNLLVLLAFAVERQLRHPFNMFILNLAVTDFFVAITAMSFYTVDSLLGFWPFGTIMCGVWIYFDFAMTFASVFTLVAISIDRFWCVTWPVHYKIHNRITKNIIIVAVIWFCVIAIWTPPFIFDRMKHNNKYMCIWEPSDNRDFVIFVAVIGHYIPCVLMVSCYFKVYYVMRRQAALVGINIQRATHSHSQALSTSDAGIPSVSNGKHVDNGFAHSNKYLKAPVTNSKIVAHSSQVNSVSHLSVTTSSATDNTNPDQIMRSSTGREKRIFITLSYVLFSYLVCWFPFYIAFDINAWKPELVPSGLYTLLFWTSYINSTINPFMYAYTSDEFRQGFIKVLKCLFKCISDH